MESEIWSVSTKDYTLAATIHGMSKQASFWRQRIDECLPRSMDGKCLVLMWMKYVIVWSGTVVCFAESRPATMNELRKVSGIKLNLPKRGYCAGYSLHY